MTTGGLSSVVDPDISTPSLDSVPEKLDPFAVNAMEDRDVLEKLVQADKTDQVDDIDINAISALNHNHEPPTHLNGVQILYSRTTPPSISPEEVLMRCRSPLQTSNATPSHRVDKVSDPIIVKEGPVDPSELNTMLFVKQHTRIAVPTVHIFFTFKGCSYLVMEYISGGDLQHLWPDMQETERRDVLSQLLRYIDELRAITPSCTVPGPVGGGVCLGRWFSEFSAGPFKSHQALVDWWNSKFTPATDLERPDGSGPERFKADHPLVFTHGDLAPRNLILHEDVLWVVDWAQAGGIQLISNPATLRARGVTGITLPRRIVEMPCSHLYLATSASIRCWNESIPGLHGDLILLPTTGTDVREAA